MKWFFSFAGPGNFLGCTSHISERRQSLYDIMFTTVDSMSELFNTGLDVSELWTPAWKSSEIRRLVRKLTSRKYADISECHHIGHKTRNVQLALGNWSTVNYELCSSQREWLPLAAITKSRSVHIGNRNANKSMEMPWKVCWSTWRSASSQWLSRSCVTWPREHKVRGSFTHFR